MADSPNIYHCGKFGCSESLVTWKIVGCSVLYGRRLSIESWFFDRDPYNVSLLSPHNCVV